VTAPSLIRTCCSASNIRSNVNSNSYRNMLTSLRAESYPRSNISPNTIRFPKAGSSIHIVAINKSTTVEFFFRGPSDKRGAKWLSAVPSTNVRASCSWRHAHQALCGYGRSWMILRLWLERGARHHLRPRQPPVGNVCVNWSVVSRWRLSAREVTTIVHRRRGLSMRISGRGSARHRSIAVPYPGARVATPLSNRGASRLILCTSFAASFTAADLPPAPGAVVFSCVVRAIFREVSQ